MALARPALALALVALAAGLYLPTLSHEWLNYDDDVYITDNPGVQQGLTREGVAWAFSTREDANWFPLTRLSWMLDYELAGLSAMAFHRTNLLLHALATLVLFLGLVRLSGAAGRSAFVAAVFAAHPLHVESVAWAAARKDTLSAVFFFLAILLYAGRGRRGPSLVTQVALLACLALGFMAKPVVLSLPFVLLLLDEWPLERLRRAGAPLEWDARALGRAALEKLPLLALAVAFGFVALAAQGGSGMVAPLERLGFWLRVENAVVSYASNVVKAFAPSGLAVFYPYPARGIDAPVAAGSLLLLLALTAGAAYTARRRPYAWVGWAWYLVTLAPAVGIVQVGSQATADRYTYLPLVGLAIVVAWGATDLAERFLGSRRPVRAGLAALGCAVVAALSAGTLLQLRHWRDSESLFLHALRVTDANFVAHAHLGFAYLQAGRVADGVRQYRLAVEANPDYLRAVNNLAWLLATLPQDELRQPALAVRLSRRAAQAIEAREPESLAAALDTLAAALAADGRYARAVETATRALDLARARGDAALARDVAARLALYRDGRPYTELPGPPAPAAGDPDARERPGGGPSERRATR